MISDKRLFITGILGAKGVALGALGAHFLKSKVIDGTITADQLNGFETGVKYHMLHTIVMLVIIFLSKHSTALRNQISPKQELQVITTLLIRIFSHWHQLIIRIE